MNEIVATLKPANVWKEFQGIMGVPRPSKKEEKMVKYLEDWAIEHKVRFVKEPCGNIIMTVPATPSTSARRSAPAAVCR